MANGGGGGEGAAEGEFAVAKTSVWWDIENCHCPKWCDPNSIARNIGLALHKMDYRGPLNIWAYGDTSNIPPNVSQALSSTGVTLNHVPADVKDASDKRILVDMLFWAIDNPAPANYLLISGDRDFSNALHRLTLRRYNILLARPQNASAPLVAAAKSVWLWTSLVSGSPALLQNENTSVSDSPISEHAQSGNGKVLRDPKFDNRDKPKQPQYPYAKPGEGKSYLKDKQGRERKKADTPPPKPTARQAAMTEKSTIPAILKESDKGRRKLTEVDYQRIERENREREKKIEKKVKPGKMPLPKDKEEWDGNRKKEKKIEKKVKPGKMRLPEEKEGCDGIMKAREDKDKALLKGVVIGKKFIARPKRKEKKRQH